MIERHSRSNQSAWSWGGAVLCLLVGVFAASEGHGANERLLGPGDVVEINVYRQPDLSTVSRLGRNGALNVPLIGEVALEGKSEREAEKEIARLLSEGKFVRDPQVSLFIREYLSHQVSVIGHVNAPGRYPFESGDSILDVIALSGGFREDASGVVVLTRPGANGDEYQRLDIEGALIDESSEASQSVEDGDVIYALKMDVVYVYGEVREPGMYRLDKGMSVMQAIAVAGSLTEKGSSRGIEIRRRSDSGSIQVVKAELTDDVRAGDVIHVKESIF